MEPESPGPDEAKVGSIFTRTLWGPDADQSHQVYLRPRGVPDSPGLGDILMGTRVTTLASPGHDDSGPGPGEAQVGPEI